MASIPNENDVLLGRGTSTNTHSGNIQFRSLVNAKKSEYSAANKKGKRSIALSIIEKIKAMDPPGKFLCDEPAYWLKRGEKGIYESAWIRADDKKAIDKVTHCLREKKRSQKKEKENDVIEITKSSNPHPPLSSDADNFISDMLKFDEFDELNEFDQFDNLTTDSDEHDTQITMREWIDYAIHSVDISSVANELYYSSYGTDSTCWPLEAKMSLALSSDSYLLPALKIAHLLADQISREEEVIASHVDNEKVDGNVPLMPTPGYNWSERIVINVSSAPIENDVGLEPLPFSPDEPTPTDPKELQSLLYTMIPNASLLLENVDDENENGFDETSKSNNICYQSISTARILPSLADDEGNGGLRDKLQRIHSLGLVFYELFSGGKRPPELLQNLDSNVPTIPKSDPNTQDDAAIEFASAMNIFDQLGSSDDELFEETNEQHTIDSAKSTCKKSRSEYITCTSKKNCIVSVDPLKMQGIPVSLCDLITNMIDCGNGDLRGDESYSKMADVRSDLQLMIDKPSTFLENLDIEKISMTGLKLNETIFGRDQEFSDLCSSYQRSISRDSQSEFAIISGPSGTGKSVLALKLANFATTNGGIFLSGKFDQLQQTKPFSAIASAFNEYCDILANDKESSNVMNVLATLRETFKQDAYHLVNVIPNLCPLLDYDENKKHVNINEQDCVDAQKRLQYLLCRFVEVISSSSGTPVTLFLDDLQWADTASIAVIRHLLLSSSFRGQSKRFFFLGCYREDGMSPEHPILGMISSVRQLGVHETIIPLSCMDKDTINEMISDLLCLSPRLTRSLSEIVFHKTKGNPFFFSRLMMSLGKEGLLRLSLSRRRWEWDEEKIQMRKIPDNVALFLTSAIGQLPLEVQSSLCVLSCFGASTNIALIQVLERETGLELMGPLKTAAAEGLLVNIDGEYRFCHDRVQEAAYAMMKPEERCLFHFQYGIALCNETIGNCDNDMLFASVDQVNRGGPSAVTDAEQGVLIANLNLTAGKRALGMSDFTSAFKFFDNGISFLRKNHWKDHYFLSLQLFEKAATCSFAVGDLVHLKILSEQILTFAQSFEDTLNIMYITIISLYNSSEIEEAIEKGVTIMSKLGEGFPESFSDSTASLVMEETKSMLLGLSDDALLNYKPITDSSKIMAMKFLRSLALSMLMSRPASLPIVIKKIVSISLAHGMHSLSAIGFVYFGSMLAQSGNIREGYRYVTIARNLIARFGSKDVAGEVIVIASQIAAYVEPVQTILEYHLQGHNVSLEAGDLNNAIFNMLFYCAMLFWTGVKLATTRLEIDSFLRLAEQHNHLTGMSNSLPLSRNISILIGTEGDADIPSERRYSCNGSLMDQPIHEKNPHAVMVHYFNKMYITFMFREFDAMQGFAEKYFEYKLQSRTLLYVTSAHTFFAGLASFWVHRRQSTQSNDSTWAERGIQCKLAMKNWADSSQWNFLNKLHLLEAEEYFCGNKIECAKLSYDNAIASAREHKFINDEALACELAGFFYTEIGEKNVSLEYFTRAHEKYHEWGAFFKASKLFEIVQSIVPTHPVVDRGPFWQYDDNASSSRKRTSPIIYHSTS